MVMAIKAARTTKKKSPQLVQTPELKNLVTSKDTKTTDVHNWYFFPHSFSPNLIDFLLNKYAKNQKQIDGRLLDMFSGGGTSILRAKQLGLNADGFDIMPLSVCVGNAKLQIYNEKEIKKHLKKIIKEPEVEILDLINNIPEKFVTSIFLEGTLARLFYIKKAILQTPVHIQDFFLTALLKTVEETMNAKKAGGFLRGSPRKRKSATISIPIQEIDKKVHTTIEEAVKQFIHIVNGMLLSKPEFNEASPNCQIQLGDARAIPKPAELYKWVITSPPYPNRQDYTRIFATELLFTFSEDLENHKTLRYSTLRSHPEAKAPTCKVTGYTEPTILKSLEEKMISNFNIEREKKMERAKQRGEVKKFGKFDARLGRMIRGYFEDMYLVLQSLRPHLHKDAHVCFVVSNVRHFGVSVEVDKLLAEIAENIGYTCKEILVARERGNSAQQMRLYTRSPSRESIVVLQPTP